MAHKVLHQHFGWSLYMLSQLTSTLHEYGDRFHAFQKMVHDSRPFSCSFNVGSDSTTGELSSTLSGNLFMHVFSSQQCKPHTQPFLIHPLVLYKRTGCIASTKLILTAVILNCSEASGPLTNGSALKRYC